MKTILVLVCAMLMALPAFSQSATSKPQSTLSEVEKLQLMVAEKDAEIATLQQQILRLEYQVSQQSVQTSEESLQQLRTKIGAAHNDSVVVFSPQGAPSLQQSHSQQIKK